MYLALLDPFDFHEPGRCEIENGAESDARHDECDAKAIRPEVGEDPTERVGFDGRER